MLLAALLRPPTAVGFDRCQQQTGAREAVHQRQGSAGTAGLLRGDDGGARPGVLRGVGEELWCAGSQL